MVIRSASVMDIEKIKMAFINQQKSILSKIIQIINMEGKS